MSQIGSQGEAGGQVR